MTYVVPCPRCAASCDIEADVIDDDQRDARAGTDAPIIHIWCVGCHGCGRLWTDQETATVRLRVLARHRERTS